MTEGSKEKSTGKAPSNYPGKERHMYPGNNTPVGFFSYYQYILSQKEANKIICIKGGPGVGKSTFMKRIGQELLADGHDVDFMHCSSDPSSLDGIVLRDLKIAFIDSTAPHIVDPINPGAVDSIIHLGDFWDEGGIRIHKEAMLENRETIAGLYEKAYNYLAAAGSLYANVKSAGEASICKAELYKMTARIINVELAHKEISAGQGEIKKYFASAITPSGFENYVTALVKDYARVYVLKSPVGVSSEHMLELFAESALYRGFDTEAYYCPMDPSEKLEHLLIPALGAAFVTSNKYHTVDVSGLSGEVTELDLFSIVDLEKEKLQRGMIGDSMEWMDKLLNQAVECLAAAKKEHDALESYYIPNMDFIRIEELRQVITEQIRTTGRADGLTASMIYKTSSR